MAEKNGTPCDEFAKKNGSKDMTHSIAAIGTDFDEKSQNLLDILLVYYQKTGTYPEYLAWWLFCVAEEKWSDEGNVKWVETVISRGIPVLVAHKDAKEWMEGRGRTTGNTWKEVKSLMAAGYKWSLPEDFPFPTLCLPKKTTLLSAAKLIDEDLVETIANLKVSGDDAEKVVDKDAEEQEEGSDKE